MSSCECEQCRAGRAGRIAADPAVASDGDKLRSIADYLDVDARKRGLTGSDVQDFLRGLADRIDPPIAESVGAAPVTCDGFAWIGQSFTPCDRCGRPFWEHTHQQSMKAGAGPFDRDPWELVAILAEQAHSIRLKWDDTYRAAAVSQPVEGSQQ